MAFNWFLTEKQKRERSLEEAADRLLRVGGRKKRRRAKKPKQHRHRYPSHAELSKPIRTCPPDFVEYVGDKLPWED